jgi:hypothetical protein
MMVLCIVATIVSCATTEAPVPMEKKEAVPADFSIPLGWIDGNTFRAKSTSATKDGAISAAQNTVIEKFITERVKASQKVIDPKSTGVAIVNEFGGTVKAGSVIREKKEADMVTIIYEVKGDNLKNRVLGKK